MSSVDLSSYRKLYLETAKEYANSLSRSCMMLSIDPKDKEAIKNMHIASHSLHSQSAVMGYAKIGFLSSAIEKITKDIIDKNSIIGKELLKAINEAVQSLRASILNIEKGNREEDTVVASKKLEEATHKI